MTRKITLLTSNLPADIFKAQQPPCLSLYQPTHRYSPERQQDPIRFRNLVKELGQSMRKKYPAAEIKQSLEPFYELAHDYSIWNNTLDGLAALASPGLFEIFALQRHVAEMAIVANSFHIKPLRHVLQTTDRYMILGLSLDRIRLFEGNRYVLDEIEPAEGVPRTLTEALGDQLTEPNQMVTSSYAGVSISGSMPHRHGYGSRQDEVEKDMERFFRAIDRAVLEHHCRHARLPLLLAALPEHHHSFQQVSHNPFLLADGIETNPGTVSLDELREKSWKALEPKYLSQLSALGYEFERSRIKGLGSDNMKEIAEAAVAGRVTTLLLEDNRQIAGKLNKITGQIQRDDITNPAVDDVLDDMGELAERMGGKVFVLPPEHMPTHTGIAAIYRY